MLLKSIKLENFRQFRNESIDFAQGEGGKNVTIIIGENGTGKTTFAQAFFWCLYGETEFSDKIILNKMVATEMTPGSEEKVRVTLALRHGEVDYTLIREQAYHKDYANNVKGDNTVFDIAIKDTSGNTSYVKKSQCEAEVKSILPKELSRYFFFDGERIEKMSKDISTGKKATDFAEAVKGLLGLNAMISAIGHFNPRSSLSVIGSYEKSFDSKSNTKIQEYTAKIDKCNARLAEIDAALEELDTQKAAAETRKSEKVIELKQYSEGKKLQKEKEDLQKQIENTTRMRATVYKTMCKDFNASMSPFFSISLIKRALEVLSRHDYSGKDIPFIRDKTIEYAFYWNDGIYEEIEQRALREILEKLMGELSEREQAVLIARYGFEDGVEKTLEEVGQTFGVTRERIRQIESKALRKLSHPTRIRELKDFL